MRSHVSTRGDTPRAPWGAPADLATEHLEHELCELSSHLAAGMARWISLVDEYDRREGWGSWWGVKSTAHWISWRCNEELVFRNPRGERIENSPQPPPGSLQALLNANRATVREIDHHTLLKGDGERMDLPECVYAVAKAIKGPADPGRT
ncbi:MAG: hypothetical protein ACJ75I_02475 [Solirubrobacterales bacterium]